MKVTVGVARCAGYEPAHVQAAVRKAVERAGGLPAVGGKRALIKPNLLGDPRPGRGVNTHPEVLRATIRLFKELGAEPFVAELPGIGPDSRVKEAVSEAEAVCRDEGVEFRLFKGREFRRVEIDGAVLSELHLPGDVLDAEFIVSLAKLKTHMLTTVTAAVKNLFGCLPFFERKKLHAFGARDKFAHALLDILKAVRPDFSIIDAVDAMEGRGPSDGRVVRLGYIVAGADAVAVDSTACLLAGWNPQEIHHLSFADERGLGTSNAKKINIVSDDEIRPAKLALPPTSTSLARHAPGWVHRIIYTLWKVQPKILEDKCTGCGTCAAACPTNAITIIDEKAVIDRSKCIECFCCQELCPYGAVGEKLGIVTRLVEAWRGVQNKVSS